MKPCTWSSVRGALKYMRYEAYGAADVYTDWLAADINRQAHRALCDQLRNLAARLAAHSTRRVLC